jgi:hypothetical protein
MDYSRLFRLSGLALVLAAVLFITVELLVFSLMGE